MQLSFLCDIYATKQPLTTLGTVLVDILSWLTNFSFMEQYVIEKLVHPESSERQADIVADMSCIAAHDG
jgi:hypothetical protein